MTLTQSRMGRFFCLAGIGGYVSGMIESTKAGKVLVAIDGCPVACAKKTLEHAGFSINEYVQVTDLGIEKNHDLTLDPSGVKKGDGSFSFPLKPGESQIYVGD